jgi:hypothetical protein
MKGLIGAWTRAAQTLSLGRVARSSRAMTAFFCTDPNLPYASAARSAAKRALILAMIRSRTIR